MGPGPKELCGTPVLLANAAGVEQGVCVHVSGASHAAKRCAKVEISPHAFHVCNEVAASGSIADATYCVVARQPRLASPIQCADSFIKPP